MVKIKIEHLLFWVLIALLIIMLLWRAFGSSPTTESIGLVLTVLGALFGWISIQGSKNMSAKLKSMEQEERKQTQILSEIKAVLEKK